MVSEQSEMIQRIDANTYAQPGPFWCWKSRVADRFGREDVVDNVEGAQKELLKYWSRVSGNRWLIAKMFGVLVCPPVVPSLPAMPKTHTDRRAHADLVRLDGVLPTLGIGCRVEGQNIAVYFPFLYNTLVLYYLRRRHHRLSRGRPS